MPLYTYLCQDCKKEFDKLISIRKAEEEEIPCPDCNSKNTARFIGAPMIQTENKLKMSGRETLPDYH